MNIQRLLQLTSKYSWASRGKVLLLVMLIAVCVLVQLVVAELSRLSTQGLDDAIASDIGLAGQYMVEVNGDLGKTVAEQGADVSAAVEPFISQPVHVVEVIGKLTPECPPFEQLGEVSVAVLRDPNGRAVTLPFGNDLNVDTQFCIGGQSIPASGVYIPRDGEQKQLGSHLFIHEKYGHLAALSVTQPGYRQFQIVTGRAQSDESKDIELAVRGAIASDMARYGLEPGDVVSVFRAESGETVRAASEGVSLVYSIIGVGVLLLGGIGLLVAQSITVRQRTWFFGLVRALGARPAHVAFLVVADVLLILVLGTAVALILAAAGEGVVEEFANQAFQVNGARLLTVSSISTVLMSVTAVLVIAAAYPAVQAVRQDPLDVLEPKRT